MAWANRFISNSRTSVKALREFGELSSDEIDHSLNSICWSVQRQMYGTEIKTLLRNQQLPATSELFHIKPMLDDGGILRIHGRTDLADSAIMSHESKRSIVMPKDHH